MTTLLPEQIEKYVLQHSNPESTTLKALHRETQLNVLLPQMLSGHLQGNFLKMISAMIKPSSILEIGTFTGYSAICLAEGLAPNGFLHTIDINEELEELATKYFEKAGVSKQIKQYIGNAVQIIPTLKMHFDLVFIDADKQNYALYYDLVFDQVKPGGYIIADNVLWSGKVAENIKPNDKDTLAIHRFNEKVNNDNRVDNFLIPIRDGLMIAQKK
jgi:caffeoyl-CoA O-methyltransferase